MSPKKTSQATDMVLLAEEHEATFFTDQYDTPHIRYSNDGVLKIYPTKTGAVKQWLAGLLWDAFGKAPGDGAVNAASNILKAKARKASMISLYNRVAPGELGNIWIDMTDENWRAIYVTKEGWEVHVNPPTMFRRFTHMKAIPTPVPGGDPREILEFVNVKDPNQRLLFVIAMVSCFIPDIPHVVMVCHGPHGSGKSMAQIALREIVDPSMLKLLSLPRKENEFKQQLFHHYQPSYDNVGRLPAWASDTLCRAVTGAGTSKRELYSDDDDVIYAFRRCLGLNGINIAAQRSDLLDRSILIEFSMMEDTQRMEDRELEHRLRERGPHILGGVLDALVKAMNIYPDVKLSGLSRMADFERWGYAIAEAIGYGGEAFLGAYRENREAQSEEALKASIVAIVLIKFLNGRDEWMGTPSELLAFLASKADDLGISPKQKAWPKRPHILTRRLNEITPSLREAEGYIIERNRTKDARIVRIYKTGKVPTSSVDSVIASSAPPVGDASDAVDTTLGQFSGYNCASCGMPLNEETGTLMDTQTMRYYCRQHFVANKRAEERSQ